MVSNGQLAVAATWNNAFLSRTADSGTVARITLANALPESGATINNAQRLINEIRDAVGVAGEGDAARKVYANNFYIVDNESYKQSIEKLDSAFDPALGHDHDGLNSKKVSAADLLDINYYRANWGDFTFVAASGTSIDISANMSGKVPGGDDSTAGVVTTAPNNRVEVRANATDTYIEDAGGQRVYGRITEAAGVWTLSFFTNEAGVETAHTLSSQDIHVYFREVYTLDMVPTFSADSGFLGSLDLTADIIAATTSIGGKVLLATAVPGAIAATGSAGASTTRVALEDHTHAGVHSVDFFGHGAPYLGDVVFKSGLNITLSNDAGAIKIDGPSSSGAAGSVQIAGAAGAFSSDPTKLFWDDTNDRLGIGTNSPQFFLDVLTAAGANGFAHRDGTRTLASMVDANGVYIGSITNHNFVFLTNNVGSARIKASNKYFYIGANADPTGVLELAAPALTGEYSLVLNGFGGGSTSIRPSPGGASGILYTLPAAQGGVNTVLQNNGSGVLSWSATAGSGGGGGSLQWVEDGETPTAEVEFSQRIFKYQQGLTQTLYALIKVPNSYTAGGQVQMRTAAYSPATTGTLLMSTRATLIRAATDAMSSTTNQRTSTNAAITLSAGTVNEPQPLTFDLSSVSGQINGVSIAAGDFIKIELFRGTDTSTDDARALVYAAEMSFA